MHRPATPAGYARILLFSLLSACSSEDPESDDAGSGGNGSGGLPFASGGMENRGGTSPSGSGGTPSTGGGEPSATGGSATGGTNATGGTSAGGQTSTGGSASSGGSPGTGGAGTACTPSGRAHNPLVTHIFTADPNAVVYGDRVYLYVSHDEDGQSGYEMIDYRGFSSDDMVNWQDHGVLIHSDDLEWAGNLYAPGACEKDGKYYLYMPNGGDSIGVAVADDPGGPFLDPLGTSLVTRDFPGANVTWLFDPACFVDDDGQGYLYFGGGDDMGDNARVVRLGPDMISLMDASATPIPVPNFYEALHMHKHGDTYYLQYSADFSVDAPIDYMTSQDPMTGFEFRGTVVENDHSLATQINMSDNNHGSLIDFRGKSYQFYHNRKLTMDIGTDVLNNRSVAVDEVAYGTDGALTKLSMSLEDFTVEQVKCLDGHAGVEAETLAGENGIEILGNAGETVRVGAIDPDDWVGYSQVDFRSGTTSLVLEVSSPSGGGTINVSLDDCLSDAAGTSIGSCEVESTGGAEVFSTLSCPLAETSGPHDLCLSFSGNTDFELDSWHLE